MTPRTRSMAVALLALLVLASPACKREARKVREIPPAVMPGGVVVESDLHPGRTTGTSGTRSPYETSAYEVAEGQRLYEWFNCVGCHSHGGGGEGPALMDNKWIYGSDPSNIFETIVEGRPNGMPSFRGKIADYQVWQIVAYVRSLSGLLPKDVSPSRSDHMSAKQPEQSTPVQPPRKTAAPRPR